MGGELHTLQLAGYTCTPSASLTASVLIHVVCSQGLPPRASASEVEALLRTLPKRTRSRVMEAHHSYVPMPPYIEGAYMTVLHLMKVLPSLTEAAAVAPASVYGKAFGQLGPADAARAQAVAADARQLSRIKRELAWHWRQDELLDQRQRVLNQVCVGRAILDIVLACLCVILWIRG